MSEHVEPAGDMVQHIAVCLDQFLAQADRADGWKEADEACKEWAVAIVRMLGFTPEMLGALRSVTEGISGVGLTVNERQQLRGLAARLTALLPPEEDP